MICLERGVEKRAAERGQGFLYHPPEAEGGRGDTGQELLGEEDKPNKRLLIKVALNGMPLLFILFLRMSFYSLNKGKNGIACRPPEVQPGVL